ncbi:MAG: YncE family protein [Candidatus Binatia bacterium]
MQQAVAAVAIAALLPVPVRAAPMASTSFSVPVSALSGGGAAGIGLAGGVVGATIGQAAPPGRTIGGAVTNAGGVWPAFRLAAPATPATVTPTPTALPTRTATLPTVGGSTPTRTRTPTPIVTGGATPTGTAAPPLTPTRTPTGGITASPTSSPTAAPTEIAGFYGRGDANCTVTLSAADVTGTVRGVTGQSACQNDDCDRDGQVTAADVDCAARCLFGECPIPPYAPQIAAVLPHSAAGIVPLSVVRVVGTNFGSGERLRRVIVGGVAAEFIDAPSATEWLVVVPELPPGNVDVVVFNGDLASAPFAITVVALVPIGALDTFEGALDMLDSLLVQFLTLDLDSLYGQSAAAVRTTVMDFRQQLGAQRAALQTDPGYTAEKRAILDALFDGVGLPDMLRAALDAFTAAAAQTAGRGGTAALAPTVITRIVGQTTRVMATQLVRVAPAVELPALASVGAALGIVAAVVAVAVVAADTPIITKIIPGLARPGEVVEIEGQGFGALPPLPSLLVKTKGGTIAVPALGSSGGLLQYPFPAAVGVCGRVDLALQRLLKTSNTVTVGVQPVLKELLNTSAVPGAEVTLRASGAVGCPDLAWTAEFPYLVNSQPVLRELSFLTDVGVDFLRLTVPELLPPATYGVRLKVGDLESAEQLPLRVANPIEDLEIKCFTGVEDRLERLVLPPGQPAEGVCMTYPRPLGTRFPHPRLTSFYWSSSPPAIVVLEYPGMVANVKAVSVGEARITVELFVSGPDGRPYSLARSDVGYQMRVEEAPPPTLAPSLTPTATPLGDVLGYVGMTSVDQPLQVLDATHQRVVGSIPLRATGVATDLVVSHDRARAYVLRSAAPLMFVDVLDLRTHAALAAIPVCAGAAKAALRSDDAFLYVACRGEHRVELIRTATNTSEGTIEFDLGDRPKFVAVAPAGDRAYVILDPNDDIAIIDTNSQQSIRRISGFSGSNAAVAFSPNGSLFYVLSLHAVTVYHAQGDFAAQIGIENHGSLEPIDIVVTPNGLRAYASITDPVGAGRVIAIDLATKQVVKVLDFTKPAFHLALTPDGSMLFVTGRVSGTKIQVIATTTDTVVNQIDLPRAGAIAIVNAP